MWRGCSSFRLASALTLVCFVLGCTTWKRQEATPEQVMTGSKRPERVRVIKPDESKLELWYPQLTSDSLVGRVGRTDTTRMTGVALAEIKELQVQKTSAGKTVLLVAGVGLAALILVAAATYEGPFGDDNGSSSDSLNSCPMVYSWDGKRWRLDSGTFGGAIMPALARTDVDNLLHPAPLGDSLRLRVVNRSRETDYLDHLAVLAVDHAPGSTVVPDGEGRLHSVRAPVAPGRAVDFRGRDVLPRVGRSDGWFWESSPAGRDSSRAADVRDGIELSFPRPAGATAARLLVDASNSAWAQYMMARFVSLHGRATQAWYDSVAADPRLAQRIGRMMAREAYLGVSVKVNGRWQRQGLVREAGPEVSKQQILPLDLSGVQGDTVTVRLESAPSLWLLDRIAIDYSAPGDFTTREIPLRSAVDWQGTDVRELLTAADRREYVIRRGDGADLTFSIPPLPSGRARSYVLVSRGWYRLDMPAKGEPQVALLERALGEPLAASRLVTGDLARAVAALNGKAVGR